MNIKRFFAILLIVIIMMKMFESLLLLKTNLAVELTIAFIIGGLLILAIICLTIIKKMKDK